MDNVRPDRQTLLFSATFKRRVEFLARDILSNPVRITVGTVGQVNENITQHVTVLNNNSLKLHWLNTRVRSFIDEGKLLVFVASKASSETIAQSLV